MARSTINRGTEELDDEPRPKGKKGKTRRAGSRGTSVATVAPDLVLELKRLVEPGELQNLHGRAGTTTPPPAGSRAKQCMRLPVPRVRRK
jgi:hypothetical protein